MSALKNAVIHRSTGTGDSVFTSGPDPASQSIIPQLFFQFRGQKSTLEAHFSTFFCWPPMLSYECNVLASALYILTSPLSNATVNITVSANGVAISNLFNSTIGSASVVSLPQNSTTTLSATFVPALSPTLFGVQALLITVPANAYGPSLFSC